MCVWMSRVLLLLEMLVDLACRLCVCVYRTSVSLSVSVCVVVCLLSDEALAAHEPAFERSHHQVERERQRSAGDRVSLSP